MKLVYLAVSFIVAAIVDCRSPSGYETTESQEINTQQPDLEEEEIHETETQQPDLEAEEIKETTTSTIPEPEPLMPEEDSENDEIFEGEEPEEVFESEEGLESDKALRSTCKASIGCSLLDGFCVTNAAHCRGRLVPSGCIGTYCKCCIPGCPEDQGFFKPTGSSQCFKIYNVTQLTWAAGRRRCQSLGLALAKPYDAIALRSYIQQRFGLFDDIWVDARGDGSKFVWQRDGKRLSSNSPLWYSGHPGSYYSTNHCLTLLTIDSYWKSFPNQPYHRQFCTTTEFPLCELIMG